MSLDKDLQIVSFQWPIPANYGGVIDVYHLMRALKNIGVDFTLHSYAYRDRMNPDISLSPANSTFIYKRDIGVQRVFRTDPYIIASRRNELLRKRLATLPARTPIIFEGLHTCAFLNDVALSDKIKIVRAHNVEHDYYRQLAHNSSGVKKLYLKSEAIKLSKYEKMLKHADIILAISPEDTAYFSKHYPKAKTIHIPCFYDDSMFHSPTPIPLEKDSDPYILYHGNLAVEENAKAVNYIIKHLLPMFGEQLPLKIAGQGAGILMRRLIERTPNVELIDSPTAKEMDTLIENAHITLLITNQNTGIKLKLLDTLAKARGHILASPEMVGDPSLKELLKVADTPSAQRLAIKQLLAEMPNQEWLQKRRDLLRAGYDTEVNARKILSLLP